MICPKCKGTKKVKMTFKPSSSNISSGFSYCANPSYQYVQYANCEYCKASGKLLRITHVFREIIKAIRE